MTLESRALRFSDEDALLVALASGVVPESVQREAVAFARQDGALVVAPERPLDPQIVQLLVETGVELVEPDAALEPRRTWFELIRPRPIPESDVDTRAVLFALTGETALIDLAAELLRLGCDRQRFCLLKRNGGCTALLLAENPPYFSVMGAKDEARGLSAFVPVGPSQAVFEAIGTKHALRHVAQAAEGTLLLMTSAGPWMSLPDGPWQGIDEVLEVTLPAATPLEARMLAQPLVVPLRLSRAHSSVAPTLWVIEQQAEHALERLLDSLPYEIVQRLTFAMFLGEDDLLRAVLRVRPGHDAPPELGLTAEAFVPLHHILNLFVPLDTLVEPPLGTERVRELLAPDPELICWLTTEGTGVRRFQLHESCFRPLHQWVAYVVEREAEVLRGWVREAVFEFDAYEGRAGKFVAAKAKAAAKKEELQNDGQRRRAKRKVRSRFERVVREDQTGDVNAAAPTAEPLRPVLLSPSETEAALAELEVAFLSSDAPLDAAGRGSQWAEMGQLAARLDRAPHAARAFARSVWESDDLAPAGYRVWIESVLNERNSPEVLHDALSSDEPYVAEVFGVATLLAGVAGGVVDAGVFREDAFRLSVWLSDHDEVLDVRSVWLAHLGLSRVVGGDPLLLARAHDRVFRRLERGLSLERDVPAFVRRGRSEDGRVDHLRTLVGALMKLRKTYHSTERHRKPVEAPIELTGAYVDMVFAIGFARLGEAEQARRLMEQGRGALDEEDPIHGFAVRAFHERLVQALEGAQVETPLSAPLVSELNQMEKFDRYKIDRLRADSAILEPQEHLNPFHSYQIGATDPRGPEFAPLRGLEDQEVLLEQLTKIIDLAETVGIEDRGRLLDGALDFLPRVPMQARGLLFRISGLLGPVAEGRKALLLQEVLMLSGFFDDRRLSVDVVQRLTRTVEGLEAAEVYDLARHFSRSLRGLRRAGLRDEARALLEAAERAVKGKDGYAIAARVNIASGWVYLGDLKRAEPTIQLAQAYLEPADVTMKMRLAVHRALCQLWSQADIGHALSGFGHLVRQLPLITDSFGTYTHYCLSVIDFMEALVLGHASERLTLGDDERRWLEEDEHLVRRRIHRDLSASGEQTT